VSGGLSATRVMLIAIAAGVIGRWANDKKALPSIGGMLEVVGALVLISLMDSGSTQPVAKGFAWLFFAAVMLSDSSPLTGLAKAESTGRVPTPATGGAPAGVLDTPATRIPATAKRAP
jgi:hypothetical protein